LSVFPFIIIIGGIFSEINLDSSIKRWNSIDYIFIASKLEVPTLNKI
jgi:hypothetical protein